MTLHSVPTAPKVSQCSGVHERWEKEPAFPVHEILHIYGVIYYIYTYICISSKGNIGLKKYLYIPLIILMHLDLK